MSAPENTAAAHAFEHPQATATGWRLWCKCGWRTQGGSEYACVRDLARHLADALAALQAAHDERMTKESGQALIEEADRWQRAYVRVCDEKADAEAAVQQMRQALEQIADGAESNPAHEVAEIARAALTAVGEPAQEAAT